MFHVFSQAPPIQIIQVQRAADLQWLRSLELKRLKMWMKLQQAKRNAKMAKLADKDVDVGDGWDSCLNGYMFDDVWWLSGIPHLWLYHGDVSNGITHQQLWWYNH